MIALENKRGYLLYRRLARLALAKPPRVIELRERAIRYVDADLVPRVVGVVGTAYRKSGQNDAAIKMLKLAEQLARKVAVDRLGLGEILQRRAFTLGDHGDYSGALTLTREALEIYETFGGRVEIGMALVDCGTFYQYQQRHHRALASYAAALEKLPFREADNRFAAMRNSAACHVALGQREKALRWASWAIQVAGVAPLGRGELAEMQGELLVIDQRFREASNAYRFAVDIYTEHEFWTQAAVATIQLCKTTQLAGDWKDALQIAKSSLMLYGHLNNRVAKSAVVTLAREAAVGRRLDRRLLDGLLRQLEVIRSARKHHRHAS